jgi:hypothetical protein
MFELYAADTMIDPVCHGYWRVGLVVTDDDRPPKQDSAAAEMVIGSCGRVVCIDYPTDQVPQFVESADDTDIFVYYHLDSALYDDPAFGTGLKGSPRSGDQAQRPHPGGRSW